MTLFHNPGRWLVVAGTAALLAASNVALTGCTAEAAELREVPSDDPLLSEATTDDLGAWTSAPTTRAAWIPYVGRGSVQVAHGLGRVPTSVEAYLSGDSDDSDAERPRSSFLGAGNIVTITDVDADTVTLKNNTPGDFYLRLVVR